MTEDNPTNLKPIKGGRPSVTVSVPNLTQRY